MGSMVKCEICGLDVPSSGEYRYPRTGSKSSEKVTSRLKSCSVCKRLGCPRCLRVVEERADDYFIDIFTCRPCLDRQLASAVH